MASASVPFTNWPLCGSLRRAGKSLARMTPLPRRGRGVRAIERLFHALAEDGVEASRRRGVELPRRVELLADRLLVATGDGVLQRAALQRDVDRVQRRRLPRGHLGLGLGLDEVLLERDAVARDEARGGLPSAARLNLFAGAAVRELLVPVPVREPGLRSVELLVGRRLVQRLEPARRRVEPAVADRLALHRRLIDRGDVVGRRARAVVGRRVTGYLGRAADRRPSSPRRGRASKRW